MIPPDRISAQRAAGSPHGKAQGAGSSGAPGAASATIQSTEGAAFRALLERLEKSAKDLDAASEAIDDPRQLGEVVETARASVEEALLAGSDLLEAYRAARAQGPSDDSNTKSDKPNNSPTTQARTGHGEAR